MSTGIPNYEVWQHAGARRLLAVRKGSRALTFSVCWDAAKWGFTKHMTLVIDIRSDFATRLTRMLANSRTVDLAKLILAINDLPLQTGEDLHRNLCWLFQRRSSFESPEAFRDWYSACQKLRQP